MIITRKTGRKLVRDGNAVVETAVTMSDGRRYAAITMWHWKYSGISELAAMQHVINGIDKMVDHDRNHGDGCTPLGDCFLNSLTFWEGKYYLWYNDKSGNTGMINC